MHFVYLNLVHSSFKITFTWQVVFQVPDSAFFYLQISHPLHLKYCCSLGSLVSGVDHLGLLVVLRLVLSEIQPQPADSLPAPEVFPPFIDKVPFVATIHRLGAICRHYSSTCRCHFSPPFIDYCIGVIYDFFGRLSHSAWEFT